MPSLQLLYQYLRKANKVVTFAVLMSIILLRIPFSASLASAQAPQTTTKPLQYEVSVTLKLIHVYVTDKKGNPVPGSGCERLHSHGQWPARKDH